MSRSKDTGIIFPDDSVIRSSGFFFRGIILSREAEHLLSIRIDQSIGGVQQWVKQISEGQFIFYVTILLHFHEIFFNHLSYCPQLCYKKTPTGKLCTFF